MPRGDGTGPGTGAGKGGQGQGMGGRGRRGCMGMGSGGNCVCMRCGKKIPHERGVPCIDVSCPNCGASMTREF